MHLQLCSIKVELIRDSYNETLIDVFPIPNFVIKAFSQFLENHEEEEIVLKNCRIQFQDLSISCADSSKAVQSFECLKHYNIPVKNYNIFSELVENIEKDYSNDWKNLESFKKLSEWNKTQRDDE